MPKIGDFDKATRLSMQTKNCVSALELARFPSREQKDVSGSSLWVKRGFSPVFHREVHSCLHVLLLSVEQALSPLFQGG